MDRDKPTLSCADSDICADLYLMTSASSFKGITVVVSDSTTSIDITDEHDHGHLDPDAPFDHGLDSGGHKQVLSPLSPLSRSRLQRTFSKTSPDHPSLGKPRLSTSEIIQLTNAPVTESAAKDLMDRGFYAQSSARFSQLVDVLPNDARIRRLSNVAAYLSSSYWGPVIPRMWSRFLKFGDNGEIPRVVAQEFADAVAEDSHHLYKTGKYHASLMALDMCACLVDHEPLPVMEGQKSVGFGLCNGYNFDERFGSRVQDIFDRLSEANVSAPGGQIAKLQQRFTLLEKSVCCGAEQVEDVKPLVLYLVDIGRLFDQGNTESHDLAMLCFDAARAAAVSELDRAYIERAIGRYKVDFAKTKGDLMENQRQVMQKFMSGSKLLRQGRPSEALAELSQALHLFPENAACFSKTLEARMAVDTVAAADVIQSVGAILIDQFEDDAHRCLSVAAGLIDANIVGLSPVALKEVSWRRQSSQPKQTGSIMDRFANYNLRLQADYQFGAGNLTEASALYAKMGDEGKLSLASVKSVMKASTLAEKATTRKQAIGLLHSVQEQHPDFGLLQRMLEEQTQKYLSGVIYQIWKKHAIDELQVVSHGAIGLVLLQQHALRYAELSGLPDLVSDVNKLIYAATLRVHSEQILLNESATEQAVKDAKQIWIESKEVIGDKGAVPNSASRRLAGMGSVQEAFDTIQAALNNGHLQRARRIISAIAAVDPGHPDIRLYQQNLELARRTRQKARAEYIAACEAQQGKDWEQAVQRFRTANQLRPCDFYQRQLTHAKSMLAFDSSPDLNHQVTQLILQRRWDEAKCLVDRLSLIRTDELMLDRLRAFVEVGLDDEQLNEMPTIVVSEQIGHHNPDSQT